MFIGANAATMKLGLILPIPSTLNSTGLKRALVRPTHPLT
jgi:hypothetical protein